MSPTVYFLLSFSEKRHDESISRRCHACYRPCSSHYPLLNHDLLNGAVSTPDCIASSGRLINKWWIRKNVDGRGRDIWRYYPSIRLGLLKMETNKISQVSRCRDRDSNRVPAEYVPEASPPQSICSVNPNNRNYTHTHTHTHTYERPVYAYNIEL
jgi:hypothetical protein